MSFSTSRDRLQQLEEIERDLVAVIESAGQSLLELSKEQPSEDYIISRTTEFLKGLEAVEKNLSEQISYLSNATTSHQHEAGIYGEEKKFQLVCEATANVLDRLNSLTKKEAF
ncbi:mediator of RNA polymerase II transcription subunit 11-like [Hydra vulgaris]|uniref:mediator of RNA polymerase II transcription subunit 11-like n=1 Tax=Hydra vulgaris TaxID=6087 RepID=UPI00019252A8|nr:mediator of RNA polymerase II transcription subunit 11-like [Hydra vulgaris]